MARPVGTGGTGIAGAVDGAGHASGAGSVCRAGSACGPHRPAGPDRDADPSACSEPALIDWRFVHWLIGCTPEAHALPGARERQLLQRLDALVESPGGHDRLLPRAASVVPQLLACLRDADLPLALLAEQVARDVTLVAEVIRLANSADFRRTAPVTQLDAAIRAIGAAGLREAIARVVVRPLFEARAGELAARSAARLWRHTEAKAQRCAALARLAGLDPFEGYLLGLVHNASWTVVLREMDRGAEPGPWQLGPEFVQALLARRDRLFGVIARQWRLTDGLVEAADEVLRHGSIDGASARGRMLAEADAQAGALVLGVAFEDSHAQGEADAPPAASVGPDRPGRLRPALTA